MGEEDQERLGEKEAMIYWLIDLFHSGTAGPILDESSLSWS